MLIPVRVEHDDEEGGHGWDHDEDLRHVQTPLLVAHVIQHYIWEGVDVGDTLVCDGEGGGGRDEPGRQEHGRQQGLQRLSRDLNE